MLAQRKIFHVGSHQFPESLRELLRELWFSYCSSRGISYSENGISYSENGISNSESCSENTPELSESSENGLFTPRAFFLKLGWSPGESIINCPKTKLPDCDDFVAYGIHQLEAAGMPAGAAKTGGYSTVYSLDFFRLHKKTMQFNDYLKFRRPILGSSV